MSAPLRLLRSISAPRALQHPIRTLLTLAGTMLGVAVLVAVVLVNRTITQSVTSAIGDVSGKVDLQVRGGPQGLSEELLESLRAVPGVSHATPVIEESASVDPASPSVAPQLRDALRGQRLTILGIHLLEDDYFRSYKSPEIEEIKRDPLVFLNSSTNLIVSEDFARRFGLHVMDKLWLNTPAGRREFTIWGFIRDERMARAMGGTLAVMYYQAAQVAFQRGDLVDRFDVAVEDGESPQAVRAAIGHALASGVVVEHPERRGERITNLLGSFRQALLIAGALALVAGLFLIYNTVSISVAQRQVEIGTIRALGMTRGQVRGLFTLEGALLGLLGSGLGVLLGLWLSRLMLVELTHEMSEIYLQVHTADVRIDGGLLALGLILGTGGATLSSLWPAHEATRVPSVQALRGVSLARDPLPNWRLRPTDLLAAALLLLAWPVAQLPPLGPLPLPGYLALAQVLIAAVLWSPRILLLARDWLRTPLSLLFGVEGQLACENLGRDLRRSTVATSALLLSVAMVTAVAVLSKSFERSMLDWVDQTIPADLFVTSASPFSSNGKSTPMSAELYPSLLHMPEVEAVDPLRIVDFVYRDAEVKLLSFDWAVQRRWARFTFLEGDVDGAESKLKAGTGVLVSENFARRFGAHLGTPITIPSPGGPQELTVAGVIVDYTSDQGILVIDRQVYSRVWRDSRVDTFKLYLRKGADLEQARRRVREQWGDTYNLFILSNREFKEEIRRVLSQIFHLVDALQLVTLLIAVLGIVNTLLAAVLDRTREIGLLRAVGGLRRQVGLAITLEAMLLGLCGGIGGIAAGLFCGEILLKAVNTIQLGWLWQFTLPGWSMLRLLGLVVIGGSLAGCFPALQAARLPVVKALKHE